MAKWRWSCQSTIYPKTIWSGSARKCEPNTNNLCRACRKNIERNVRDKTKGPLLAQIIMRFVQTSGQTGSTSPTHRTICCGLRLKRAAWKVLSIKKWSKRARRETFRFLACVLASKNCTVYPCIYWSSDKIRSLPDISQKTLLFKWFLI